MARDRVQLIKDRLARIADEDTKLVLAVRKFASLSNDDAKMVLALPPERFPVTVGRSTFGSIEEVRLALHGQRAKKDWPAALQAAHERVMVLMKNAEQDSSIGTLGLLLISVPPTQAIPGQAVKRFRRLRGGKLKELTASDTKPIDVEEVLEAVAK